MKFLVGIRTNYKFFFAHIFKSIGRVLRQLRGLVVSFEKEIKIVSRGFEKFFNYNELHECSVENLSNVYGKDTLYTAREKADGHMIEYFVYDGELCATTRGKFGTASSILATEMFTLEDFYKVQNLLPEKNRICILKFQI